MNLIKKKYLYFFLVFNTFFPLLVISNRMLNFSSSLVLVSALIVFFFNSFTMCLLIKKISESRKLLNQKSKSKDKDKPSDILADIELEFERRHAAKKFERN